MRSNRPLSFEAGSRPFIPHGKSWLVGGWCRLGPCRIVYHQDAGLRVASRQNTCRASEWVSNGVWRCLLLCCRGETLVDIDASLSVRATEQRATAAVGTLKGCAES